MTRRLAWIAAALLLGSLSPAPAATILTDLFAGLAGTPSNSTGTPLNLAALSLTGSAGNSVAGSLTGASLADTASLTLNASTLSLANTGIGGSFTVYDVFAGTSLLANTTYALTFTTQYSGVSLLSSFNVAVGTGTVASPTLLSSSSSGALLTLGGGTEAVTLTFSTGATPGTGFFVKFDSGGLVGLASTVAISGASLNTVPEPSAWAAFGLGAGALGFRARRRIFSQA